MCKIKSWSAQYKIMMPKIQLHLILLGVATAQPLTQYQLDGAVAHITDGQRDLMAMLDDEYESKYAVNFWNTLSGSVTIGAMLMIIGLTVGVSLICCWLKYQWSEILTGIERTYINRSRLSSNASAAMTIINSQTHSNARSSTLLMTSMDTPPSYTELFQN